MYLGGGRRRSGEMWGVADDRRLEGPRRRWFGVVYGSWDIIVFFNVKMVRGCK